MHGRGGWTGRPSDLSTGLMLNFDFISLQVPRPAWSQVGHPESAMSSHPRHGLPS